MIGTSYILDLYGVENEEYHYIEFIEPLIQRAIKIGQFNVLNTHFHQFDSVKPLSNGISISTQPTKGGCTGYVLLTESHISVHTWPEFQHIAIDVFSCSNQENAMKAIDLIIASIPHITKEIVINERGN